MIMRWNDLMPGDKIKVSKEVKSGVFPTNWLDRWWYNEILVVTEISHTDLHLCVSIKDLIGWSESFHLSPNGQYNNIDFFELVELAEE